MKHGDYFEFNKTTETIQSEEGKALYAKLETGYRLLDPQDERNNYTKDQIFDAKAVDYMDHYEVGAMDADAASEMTEQELHEVRAQAFSETKEFLARDIIGQAIRDNNSAVFDVAANNIHNIKDVEFATSDGQTFDNIVQFATFCEAQAGLTQVGSRHLRDFEAETGYDVMSSVMRVAGEAYGKDEAQQMRNDAFKEHGLVPLRVDHNKTLEDDKSVQMDVSAAELSEYRLTFTNQDGQGYKVHHDEKFEAFLDDVVSHYGLKGIDRGELVERLDETKVFEDANAHVRTFMGERKQLEALAAIEAREASQAQADQLSSMIASDANVGQKQVKAFLNHTASILQENPDLIDAIQKGTITADSKEMQEAVKAAVERQASSMETLGNQVLNDPKVANEFTGFMAEQLSSGAQKGSLVSGLVKQAGDTKQIDADLKAFEADAIKRGVPQENIDSFKGMVREGAALMHGVHQASQQQADPSERLKAIEASLVAKGIPQEALNEFKEKVLGNQNGQQAAQGKPVFTQEDSAAFVDAVEGAKGYGMANAVDAMKAALKDMSPTGHTPDSANKFYRERKAANEALEAVFQNPACNASEDPKKMAQFMKNAEDALSAYGGKFSKGDDGKLKFQFERPVDARLVTSVAEMVKGFANETVSATRGASESKQEPTERKVETASTGRITSSRFSRPPTRSAEPERKPVEESRSRGMSR